MNNLLVILTALTWNWWPTAITGEHSSDSLRYTIGAQVVASSGSQAPLFMHIGTDGQVSNSPFSGTLTAGICKPASSPSRWYDYDAAAVLSGGLQSTSPERPNLTRVIPRDLYAHVRLYIFDITAGLHPLSFGPADEQMTLGGLLLSRNNRPYPRISVGIDRWTAFPGLFGYVAIRGGITHGWLADDQTEVRKIKIHHKYAGIRIGGQKLPLSIRYEFHDAAQWGGFSLRDGDLGNGIRDWYRILLGRNGGTTEIDIINTQGNHLTSQVLGLDIDTHGWRVGLYWQNLQEDGPINFIGATMNAKDGLWGLHIEQDHWSYIQGLTFEFLNTTDQSGPYHDKDGYIFGGFDSYYLNYSYPRGWTYFGDALGNPLVMRSCRVAAYFAALRGDIHGFRYSLRYCHSDNYYRDYLTRRPLDRQDSWCVHLEKSLPRVPGFDLGISLGGDYGTPGASAFGAMICIRKQGIIAGR